MFFADGGVPMAADDEQIKMMLHRIANDGIHLVAGHHFIHQLDTNLGGFGNGLLLRLMVMLWTPSPDEYRFIVAPCGRGLQGPVWNKGTASKGATTKKFKTIVTFPQTIPSRAARHLPPFR